MKNIVHLTLALSPYSPALQLERTDPVADDTIKDIDIDVQIEQTASQLTITYQVNIPNTLIEKIRWQSLNPQAGNHDYLWQDTCLECFIGKQDINGHSQEYIEINASPNGTYAIYHFDSYRTPSILPPKKLLVNSTSDNNQQSAKIDWLNTANHCPFQRKFSFDLSQLPDTLQNFELIHPCVILFYQGHELFYASDHPKPADFHNKDFWQPLPHH